MIFNKIKKMEEKIGILVIHGFLGNLKTVDYVANFFKGKGFVVETPSLSGHNTIYTDLLNVRYTDWISDVEDAYANLKERVQKTFVFGLSMGGALSLYLQANHPEISGGILVNHALTLYPDFRLNLLPILKHFMKFIYSPGSDVKDKTQTGLAYDYIPLNALHEFIKLTKVVKRLLKRVKQPQLIFKSKEDHVIPFNSVEITLKNLSSNVKKLVILENSYHVATVDFDKDVICNLSYEFIQEIVKGGANGEKENKY